ncbi:hypothetical protein HRbin40_00561 [bacterium HR40]|nr:hypothetical protein HRbin40_00561 [bacterium HR40]
MLRHGAQTYRVREVVAVFDDYQALEDAVQDLELAGFDRAQINLLVHEDRVRERFGDRVDIRRLEDDPQAPVEDPVDCHEVAEGKAALTAGLALLGSLVALGFVVTPEISIPAAILAAAVGGGAAGTIGGMLARYLGELRARQIEEQIRSGGLLLWVQLRNEDQEQKAVAICRRYGAKDVHVHEIEREWGEEHIPLAQRQPDPFLFR